jgi:hypothetical protein
MSEREAVTETWAKAAAATASHQPDHLIEHVRERLSASLPTSGAQVTREQARSIIDDFRKHPSRPEDKRIDAILALINGPQP